MNGTCQYQQIIIVDKIIADARRNIRQSMLNNAESTEKRPISACGDGKTWINSWKKAEFSYYCACSVDLVELFSNLVK